MNHDGIDNIVVVLLQCLDSLVSADIGLGHDKLDVLILESRGVDLLLLLLFLVLVVFLILLLLVGLNSLAGLAVVVTRVVLSVLRSELGSSSLLSSGVDVLNLSLTEDTGSKVRRESQTVFVRLAYM
ncbi:unnamed protein product [Fusarium graminearum]|nr:unnamed protein product [Fusarium graminearum]VTO89142.1 unnamed protein product [Fusarium graminearum]